MPVPVSLLATAACRWLSWRGVAGGGSGGKLSTSSKRIFQEGLWKFSKAAARHLRCPVVSQREVAQPRHPLRSKMQAMHEATVESTSVGCLVKGVSRALESVGCPQSDGAGFPLRC